VKEGHIGTLKQPGETRNISDETRIQVRALLGLPMNARVHENLEMKGIKKWIGRQKIQKGILKLMSLMLTPDFIAKM
jgi:hypothetical protein